MGAPGGDARGKTQQNLHLDMAIGSSGTGLSTGTDPPVALISLGNIIIHSHLTSTRVKMLKFQQGTEMLCNTIMVMFVLQSCMMT